MSEPPTRRVAPERRPLPAVADGLLRVDAITHVPAVLREIGLDPIAALASVGLDPQIFDDPGNEIPIDGLGKLFAHAVAASGCDHLGLLVGERTDPISLGLVGRLIQHAPDVGTALRNLSKHVHLRDRGAVVPVLMANGIATLGYEIYQPDVDAGDQICDASMAIGVNIMRGLCGSGWRPLEVQLAHRRPADLGPLHRVFGARLHFDADRTALVFSSKWLDFQPRAADPARFRELADQIAAAESVLASDLVSDLRRMLRVVLLTGKGSVEEVAERLAIHRRTLNRRLRVRGTSLHQLTQETRFEIARQLVENTRMPLTDIAMALGYADASAFTRAFRRWAGRAPSDWRREPRASGVANGQAVSGADAYVHRPSLQREGNGRWP
jgi:AraC-like DNA-binding protein